MTVPASVNKAKGRRLDSAPKYHNVGVAKLWFLLIRIWAWWSTRVTHFFQLIQTWNNHITADFKKFGGFSREGLIGTRPGTGIYAL
jgi:hypothetical protein